jgi:hypothetical protein
MNAVLETVVLAFASVGLFALGHWIFRCGWQVLWKVVGILFVVSLWWAMINGPLQGHFGADHGALTGILATFGIVMAVTMAFRRFAHGWQPWAITGAALVLLLLMWFPRFDAHNSVPRQLPPTPQGTRPQPTNSGGTSRNHSLECSALSPEGRQAAGCP